MKLGNPSFSWREFWRRTASIAKRFFCNASVSILRKLSRVGKRVPDDKIFGNKSKALLFACSHFWTHPWNNLVFSPPTLVKILTSQLMRKKLLQHLENCLPSVYLPTTEAFFTFQSSFIIIVFLYGRHKIKDNYCLLFRFLKTGLFI